MPSAEQGLTVDKDRGPSSESGSEPSQEPVPCLGPGLGGGTDGLDGGLEGWTAGSWKGAHAARESGTGQRARMGLWMGEQTNVSFRQTRRPATGFN